MSEEVLSQEVVLPRALNTFIKSKGVHWVAHWRDTWWFTPKENSMYKNGEEYLYAETKDALKVNLHESLEIYNPKLQAYENVIFDEKNWYDKHGDYDERNYLSGLKEYVTIDYDDWNYIYCFNLLQYVKDKHQPEIQIKSDGWGEMKLNISGVTKKLQVLYDYREHITSYWDDEGNKGKEMKFFTYNEVYSFVRELDEQLSKLPVGSKYSDMYDNIVSGTLSKEDFLAEIIK